MGYAELRPILSLYASASTRSASASFTSPHSLQVPASTDGHCALLTLHLWVLHCRLRESMYQAKALGQEEQARQWKRTVHLLFELYWQEMDSLVRDAEEEEAVEKEEGTPLRVFTVDEYAQLAYGAMVAYDRAWHKLRSAGEKGDLLGALWRNLHPGKVEMGEAQLHRLLHYTEQMKQRSNRWTEQELMEGTIDWGPLPVADDRGEGEGQMAVMLRYTPEVHDGTSRVREGESMGVPVTWTSLWGRGTEDVMAAEEASQSRPAQSSLSERQQQQPKAAQLAPLNRQVDKG